MTDREIQQAKKNMVALLELQEETVKKKLEILRQFRNQVEAANDEPTLRKLNDCITAIIKR